MSEAVAAAPESAPEQPKADAAPKAEEPKHKLKVHGKEVELPLSEILKRAQIAEAGQGAMQKAAQPEKAQAELVESMKRDPRGTLAKLAKEHGGTELRDVAVALLHEELQSQLADAELSEDAKEVRRLKAEIAKNKADSEEAEKKQHEKAVEAAHAHLTHQIVSTLEALPEGLRRHELVANRVVDAWGYLVDNADKLAEQGINLATVTPARVADLVMKNLRMLTKELGGALKDEELDDVFDEPFRKRATARWTAKPSTEHPALTSEPKVRESAAKSEDKPRVAQNKLLRSMSRPFGG